MISQALDPVDCKENVRNNNENTTSTEIVVYGCGVFIEKEADPSEPVALTGAAINTMIKNPEVLREQSIDES